jgi:crossover junction endodeoxyribonuclease RusA
MKPLTLYLPYPPSANHYWRHVSAKVLISAEGQRYRDAVGRLIAQERRVGRVPADTLACYLAVEIDMHVPDDRRRDTDNIVKPLFDALTEAKFWLDDVLVAKHSVERLEMIPFGAVIVRIKPYEARKAA